MEIREPRIFVCFVCQKHFDGENAAEIYRSHVIEVHEEGREYVLCPLDRCKYPVRDVRSHFKIHHPTEKVPQGCQLRALIIYDAKERRKRGLKKKPSFKEGSMLSVKNGGKMMHYRSGYEKTVYECLEIMEDIIGYEVEPFPIEYHLKGRRRKYYPDLKVHFKDHTEIWEIKPYNQTQTAINQAKWLAAGNFCSSRGWSFVVKTEIGINEMKRQIKEQIREGKKPLSEGDI